MILIVTDSEEPTSDLVIDWLLFYNQSFIRLSRDTPIRIEKIYYLNNHFECVFSYMNIEKLKKVDTKDITAYWYRRSHIIIEAPQINSEDCDAKQIVSEYLSVEYQETYRILNSILNRKSRLNKNEDADVIKIKYLEEAKKVGLDIPDSLICCSKKDLYSFYKKHNGQIVTKTIGDPTSMFFAGFRYYTSQVIIDDVPDSFGLTLFQEEVKKEVELRIFYMHKQFYPSAIFSQLDKQTAIDFKNYNTSRPNRIIPFILPKVVQRNLQRLMDNLQLDSGSIDMILTPNKRYVFLEVNPVGQFEQVSFPCNYGLFKKVADYLMK